MEENKENPKKEMSIIDAIKIRTSVRSYATQPNENQQAKIKELIDNIIEKTPFGDNSKEAVRFCYINSTLGFTSSMGIIGGEKHWLCGACKKSAEYGVENYGFLLEWLILKAAELGLGTCWLGGTFTVKPFDEYLKLKEDEALWAVTPIGVPSESKGIIKSLLSWFVGSRSRKEWKELFFENKIGQELTKDSLTPAQITSLEAVRWAPSARNGQPWRIVKRGKKWLFFRMPGKVYTRLDIGIALLHWQVACEEGGIKGKWNTLKWDEVEKKEEIGDLEDLIYVITWVEE